jgi:hypothetical protein
LKADSGDSKRSFLRLANVPDSRRPSTKGFGEYPAS